MRQLVRFVSVVCLTAVSVAGFPALPGLFRVPSARAFTGPGVVATVAGTPGVFGHAGDGGPATSALIVPGDVAVDSAGNLYVTDINANRVRRVDRSGTITTFAGNGTMSGGPAAAAGDGGLAAAAAVTPYGLAVDRSDNLYVADHAAARLRKITPAGVITTVAGNGSTAASGDGGPATQAGVRPWDVAVDHAGNLYLADSWHHRIRKVNPAGVITTVAGTGAAGFSGDGGPATLAKLDQPDHVAVDSAGNLYIADTNNYRVRRVDPAGVITTVAGNGVQGDVGDGGSAVAAEFKWLAGITVDGARNLYIADQASSRIRKVDASGVITTAVGTGAAGYGGDGGTAAAAQLNWPRDATTDAAGNLYVADWLNYAVRRVANGTPVGGALRPPETYGTNRSELPCQGCAGDPVNTASGNFFEEFTDLAVPGRGPALALTRSYSSLAAAAATSPGSFGFGWTHGYGMALSVAPVSGVVTFTEESGAQLEFTPAGGGGYSRPPRVLAMLTRHADGTFTLTRRARERLTFSAAGRLVAKQDLNGETTALAYNGAGQLLTVTDPAGRSLAFGYDAAGHVASVTDPASRTVSYAYDPQGRLAAVTDVGGGVTAFGYDASHRIVAVRDPNGGTVTNAYDTTGRVVAHVDAMQRRTTFAYVGDSFSGAGGTTSITDPNGHVTLDTYANGLLVARTRGAGTAEAATWSYEYDPATLGVIRAVDPDGRASRATYDAAGNVLTQTDPLGRTTTHTYDALNDLTSTTDALGDTSTFAYDGAGNLLSASRPLRGTASTRTVTYAHADPAHPGDVTSVTDPAGKVWSSTYTAAGDLASATNPLGGKTTYTYDAVGRRLTRVAPRGNEVGAIPGDFATTYTYNPWGDVTSETDPLGHARRRTYDAKGNLTTLTDANGHTTRYAYDLDDERVVVNRADGTTVTTDYDSVGNVTAQRDAAGQATTYTYDSLNRPVSTTDPLARVTTYRYDRSGRLASLVDASGETTAYTHDAAGQLTAVSYSDGVTPGVTFAYDVVGQRTAMTDGTGTTTYTWDSLHRLTASTDGAGAAVSYSYDLRDNLTGLGYPGGATVSRAYDDAGRLSAVTDWMTNTTSFDYDADGNLTATNYPNGVVASSGFDRASRLEATTDAAGATVLASFAYTRGAAGQATSVTATGVPGGTESYTYTALDQVETVNTDRYAYDAGDNLTLMKTSTALAYDPGNQVNLATTGSASTAFFQDERGNRVQATSSSSTVTLEYDQANRLTSYGTAASYAYDGAGVRMSKTVTGVTTGFVWDTAEGMPLLIGDGTTRFVYGPHGRPIEQVSGSGATTYLHYDAVGSVRMLTDLTGVVSGTRSYDVYGRLAGATGTATVNFGFAGQYADPETGLYYMRARYYDPETGQFLSRDPAVDVTRSPYGYVDGDPLNGADPLGLWGWSNVTKFVSDHGGEILTAAVVAGSVACAISVACGVAAVGAFGPTVLAASAGVGTLGTVAYYAGVAPAPASQGYPAAASSTSALNLGRQLASEEQMSGRGTIFAGPGCKTSFRDAARAAASYGGNATDWAKMAGGSYTDRAGRMFETHWIENLVTGMRTEFKTNFAP